MGGSLPPMDFNYPEIPALDACVRTADCISGMRKLADASVDIVVTSPPYNLGKDYNKYMDSKSQGDYLKWSKKWVNQVARVLAPGGSFFLNLGSSLVNPTIPHRLLFELLQKEHGGLGGPFVLQNTIHWIKSITVVDDNGEQLSRGHFKPINSQRFVNDCHEYIFHLTLDGNVPLDRLAIGVPYKHKSNINRWGGNGGEDLRCRGNTWFIPYKTIQSRDKERPHPATFPPELPENCILLHGKKEGCVVMDPFLGLGNSWIAAARANTFSPNKVSRFIGFDLDSYYVGEAKKAMQTPRRFWDNSHLPTKEEAVAMLDGETE